MKAFCKNISGKKGSESYRFKRWTGKTWAVFNSLKRHIEIGFLSTTISAELGVKSALVNTPGLIRKPLCGSEDKDRLAAPDDLYLALLCSLLLVLGPILDVADTASSGVGCLSHDFPSIATASQTLLLLFTSFLFLSFKSSLQDMISWRYQEDMPYLTTLHQTTTDS